MRDFVILWVSFKVTCCLFVCLLQLQDVIERLDEEAMMKQYTHAPSRDPSDDSSPHGSSGGFVVRGAPWSRASNGTQQSAREKPFVPELSPKDFPTIGDGTGSKTPPVWPVRKS